MIIICRYDSGYYNLTEGKQYNLVEYIPPFSDSGFTFPAYVTLLDDNGKTTQCHAHRFKTLDGVKCDDYFKNNKG